MKNEEISGIGSVRAGEYDRVEINGVGRIHDRVSASSLEINGMGKIRGQVQAGRAVINGAGKGKGRLTAQKLTINGAGRWFRPLKADQLEVNGLLKLRRAEVSGKKFTVSGLLVCNREVTADEITIDGICSAARMYGDVICFPHREGESSAAVRAGGQLPGPVQWLARRFPRLYFGRKVSLSHSLVDQLECTQLEASNLQAKVVRTQRAVLTNGCKIQRLCCDGEIQADPSCWIGEIVSNGKITKSQEGNPMANAMLVKILDLYKEGKIDADEAEQMLRGLREGCSEESAGPSWPDDRRLRIVAYLGRKLLKRGEPAYKDLTVQYEGEALEVECWGNLSCGDVQGDVKAGASAECGDVEGNVEAGNSIECGDVKGDVHAGTDISCGDVEGNAEAGASVECGDVAGNVTAGTRVICKDAGGRN